MRRPPCTTSRSSQPARPRTRWTSGAPRSISARVQATISATSARAPALSSPASSDARRHAVARAHRRAGRRAGPRRRVHRQVLPEVGQLQRGADRIRLAAARRLRRRRTGGAAGGRPGWPNAGSSRATRRGRRTRGCTTSWRKALSRSVSSGRGRRCRRIASASGSKTPRQRGDGGAAGCDGVQVGLEGGEVDEALRGRRQAFVGQIVGGARIGVDRPDRGAQRGRAQPGRDGKVLVVVHAHRSALSMLAAAGAGVSCRRAAIRRPWWVSRRQEPSCSPTAEGDGRAFVTLKYRADRIATDWSRRRGTAVLLTFARVAKLVDAPGLGPDASDGVGVRVPPRAPATKAETRIMAVTVETLEKLERRITLTLPAETIKPRGRRRACASSRAPSRQRVSARARCR